MKFSEKRIRNSDFYFEMISLRKEKKYLRIRKKLIKLPLFVNGRTLYLQNSKNQDLCSDPVAKTPH